MFYCISSDNITILCLLTAPLNYVVSNTVGSVVSSDILRGKNPHIYDIKFTLKINGSKDIEQTFSLNTTPKSQPNVCHVVRQKTNMKHAIFKCSDSSVG